MLSKPITVLILLLLYFSIPKFDLFFVPGSVTGIRIQDLICLFLFVILFNYKINSKTFLLLLFLMIHLLYSLMVWSSYTSIYGFLRLIEYFFVAKGFQLIIEKGYWKHFYNLIFIYIFFISLGQYLTLLPNFDPGRGIIYSKQFSGPFGTPAELTYFMIPLLYLNYHVGRNSVTKLFAASFVLFNGVKAGILGFIILAAQQIKLSKLIIILPVLAFAIYFLIYEYLYIGLEFLRTTFSDTSAQSSISDPSLNSRINKWSTSMTELYQQPLALIFGFGVYSYTGALDGGILKFLFEFGLLAFVYILYAIFRKSFSFFMVVLATSFLFDAYQSSVVMPILICTYLVINQRSVNKLK